MARIHTDITGDSSSLDRAFRRANRSAAGFNRNMVASNRGMAKNRAATSLLGRTVLGLGAGYLGARGLTAAVRSSWQEMAQSAAVSAETGAAIKSTGGIANVTAKHVDKLASSLLKKTGIDDESIRSTENMLLSFRNIRNEVGKGNDIFDQATKATLDMDARMTHNQSTQESLGKSAIRLGKALNDPIKGVGALRRVGVQFTESQEAQIKAMVKSGNVMGAQKMILREMNIEFGGSAAAFGGTLPGKINILRESMRNLGGNMLTTLIPAITRVVTQLSAWFSKTKNQQSVMNTFKSSVAAVTTVFRVLAGIFRKLKGVTGSNKNTLVLLTGAFVAFKLLKLVSYLKGVRLGFVALRTAMVATTTTSVATTLAQIGTSATPIPAKIGKISAALKILRLALLSPFTLVVVGAAAIGAALILARKFKAAQEQVFKAEHRALAPGSGVENSLVPKLAEDIKAMKAAGKTYAQIITALRARLGGSLLADDLITASIKASKIPSGLTGKDAAEGHRAELAITNAKAATAKVKAALKPLTTEMIQQRNNWFDAMIGRKLNRVQDISGEDGQLKALAVIAAQIKARIAATKDVTRKLALEDQLLDVVRQQRDLRTQKLENAKQRKEAAAAAKREAAEARKQAAEAVAAARISRQFRSLGLTGVGGERTPGKANLKKQLGSLAQNVKGTILDTGKTRSMLARIRKVLSEGIVPDDVRAKIAEMLAGLRDQLRDGPKKAATQFKKANSDAILAGLGLSPEQMKVARFRLAQLGAGGTVPGARTAAFAGGVGGAPVVVHTSVNLDGQVVGKSVTTHQQKAKKRRSPSRRGHSAGSGW